jgi:putative pyruvate formate lyase activating enzyme
MSDIPSYTNLHNTGELHKRISVLTDMLKECRLCPRHCKVNRLEGELGFCRAGDTIMISSAFAHFGEEAPLVGSMGSGTIFLTHCNLRCIFCQNHDISHRGEGETVTAQQMAAYMVALQQRGCHNINFVTPTHYVPQIIAALPYAIDRDLRVPLVYNCGGYESLEVIKLLDGIIDIYMPDVKWSDRSVAEKYAQAPDYPAVVKAVLKEMHRQVGDLHISKEGVAERGLLIRHLVMPGDVAGTREIVHYIARDISPHSYVNIMSQYRPEHRARDFPELNRRITNGEYREALASARIEGLYRGFPER